MGNNVINIGPIVLAVDKAIIIFAITVFLLLLDKLDEKIAGLGKWSFTSIILGFVSARIIYVALNYAYYKDNLISIIYFWEPGYNKLAGLAFALIYTLYTVYKYGIKNLIEDFKNKSKIIFVIIILTFMTIWTLVLMPDMNKISEDNSKSLPSIELKNLQGQVININTLYNNQPIIISLWASWCPTCKREITELAKSATNLPLVLVNAGEDFLSVNNYIKSNNLYGDNVILDSNNVLSNMFDVKGLPTTLIFNADKKLIYAKMGSVKLPELEGILKQLAEPKNGK